MALFELTRVDYAVADARGETRKLLKDINMTIDRGDLFTIIGPSGSGKSSLLYLLNRLHELTAGEIKYNGLSLQAYEVTELRCQVGLLVQKPFMLPGTVKTNILAGPQLRGKRPDKTPAELMTMVGLDHSLLDQQARSLSGGEQQRVSLARLLANEPEVLLLDEPTAALNQAAAEEIEHLVVYLVKEHGLTVIMVTHDLDQAHRMGTHTALLMNGRIVEYGDTAEFFAQPVNRITTVYLQENWHGGGERQ